MAQKPSIEAFFRADKASTIRAYFQKFVAQLKNATQRDDLIYQMMEKGKCIITSDKSEQ